MSDSGRPCGINAAHDRVVAENAKLKRELAELRAVVETITAAAEYQHADILTEPSWALDYSLPFTLTVGEIRAIAAAKAASKEESDET